MYLRQKIVRNSILILSMVVGSVFLGCSSAEDEQISSGGTIETRDYSFAYDNENKNINGYLYIAPSGIVTENQSYDQEVKFTNFIVETKCKKTSFTVSPTEMTIADNSQQKIDVAIQLSEACYEPTFILHGEKIIKTILKGVDTTEPVITKENWSKTFNLQNIGEGTNVDYSNIKVTVDKMELNSRKYMTLKFVDRDDDRKEISNSNVKNVKLTIQNPTMLRFLDSESATTLTYSGDSEKRILLQSNFKGEQL